jgi:hypothetical protein
VLSNSVEMVFALAFRVGLVYLCWLSCSSISGSACIGSFLHSFGILVFAFCPSECLFACRFERNDLFTTTVCTLHML